MFLTSFSFSLEQLKGVGKKVATNFSTLKIFSTRDLLLFFPRKYLDRTNWSLFSDSDGQTSISISCRVTGQKTLSRAKGRNILKIELSDGKNRGALICFNQHYLASIFQKEKMFVISAVFVKKLGEWQATSFEYEPLEKGKTLLSAGRVVPVYPLTKGLTQKKLRKIIWDYLQILPTLEEVVPEYLIEKRKLLSFNETIHNLHFPVDMQFLKASQDSFIYREFLFFQIAVQFNNYFEEGENLSHKYKEFPLAPIESSFQFKLTAGQIKVVQEIYNDMDGEKNMHRLLQGDVGSGKTAVAVAAIYKAVGSGFQVAVVAPTTILAEQLYNKMEQYLAVFKVKVALFTGKSSAVKRRKVISSLLKGEIDLVIGTHALFSDDLQFKNLSLVIVDEQHRFGVEQRKTLLSRGSSVDYLAMSATPIPRSVSLALYSSFSFSIIPDLPHGRQPVRTKWYKGQSDDKYSILQQELKRGKQGFVIYPLVVDSEKMDLQSAIEGYKKLGQHYSGKYRVALLHGKLESEEKQAVMTAFHAGKVDILVSTTVVEVGIDNKNATFMIIEDAHRFGLAQLHQLRGRVGRGNDVSYCILSTPAKVTEVAAKRMQTIVDNHDGFKIAEIDLHLRGSGDVLGVKQSGLPSFSLGDIVDNYAIMQKAANDVKFILGRDPGLEDEANRLLKNATLQKQEDNVVI